MNSRMAIAMLAIIIAFDVILAVLVCSDILTKRPIIEQEQGLDSLIDETEIGGTFYYDGERYIVVEK